MTDMTIDEILHWAKGKKFMGKPMSFGYAVAILDRQFPVISPSIKPLPVSEKTAGKSEDSIEELRCDRMNWTPELDKQLWEMYFNDVPHEQIAQRLYCTKSAVVSRISKTGMAKKKRKLRKTGPASIICSGGK